MAFTKEQTLNEIKKSWSEFQELLAQVPAERLEEAPAVGDWSVKDLLGHLATWEVVSMDSVWRFLDDPSQGTQMYSGVELDAFNQERVDAKRDTSYEDILRDLEETHVRLMIYLANLNQAAFQDVSVESRVRLDTYEHYQEHGIDLRRWLAFSEA